MSDDFDDDGPVATVQITKVQLAVLKRLSTQRAANMFTLADLTGEMQHEGLEFLRRLGSPEHKEMFLFLANAKPETLKFLTEMREDEIDMLKNSIRLVIALGWVGWSLKWIIATAFGAFVGSVFIYKEVVQWFRSTH